MAIRYQIEESFRKNGSGKYFARSYPDYILTEDQIMDSLSHGSSFTKGDIVGMWELIFELFRKEMGQGRAIQTPIGKFTPTITGKFTRQNEKFSPGKHQIQVRFTMSATLKKSLQTPSIAKKSAIQPRRPYIESLKNISRMSAQRFRYLDLIELNGNHLKVSPHYPETGVVLVNTEEKTRNPQKVLIRTQNNKIQFQLSDLPKGSYTVEVTSVVGKAIRTTQWDGKIRVE